jgi:hypothetical protein
LIQEGADETLPLRHFLNFVEKERRVVRREFIDCGDEGREVFGAKTEEAGVLKIAVNAAALPEHELPLQGAFTTPPNPSQDRSTTLGQT